MRMVFRYVLAFSYLLAGLVHLASPETFTPIMPAWVPFPYETILLTGCCELAGSAALLTRPFRRAAGVMLALYAVCVFPANIKQAMDMTPFGGWQPGWWYHAPRLALQPVLVWWALYCGEVIDWPWRKDTPTA